MNKLIFCILFLTIQGCSGVNFLGAKKHIGGIDYVERWFKSPGYQEEVPEGTEFYGAAAEKIKHRFIIKYYISDGLEDDIEIDTEKMWKVKPSELDGREIHYINTYFYKKVEGKYVEGINVRKGRKVPVQDCDVDGWCKTYISTIDKFADEFKGYDSKDVWYIKKEHLYQGKTILTEKEKQKIIRDKIQAVQAPAPFITPPHEICEKYGGEINKRNVCYAKWKEAEKICNESEGRLPTIEELFTVIDQCGGVKIVGDNKVNTNNNEYQKCFREKGFSYEYDGYYSSTVIEKYETVATAYIGMGGKRGRGSTLWPSPVLCIEK